MTDKRGLGVDLGDKRIGVAICDSAGALATPLETIHRSGSLDDVAAVARDHARLAALAEEAGARYVVIGVPYSLDGSLGPAATKVLAEIALLTTVLVERVGHEVSIHEQDERFTTVTATQAMQTMGVKPKRRKQLVDQIAAAVILQTWLDGSSGYQTEQGHGQDPEQG